MARINIDQTPEETTPQPISGEIVTNSSLLSAFSTLPAGVSFGEAEKGEKIILLLRAHWVTMVSWILVALGLLLAPLFIVPLVSTMGFSGFSAGTGLVVVLFWYLGTLTYTFLNFLYWYFNVYIVTNERIIDVDWYSVVVRKVSSAPLAKIQDVSAIQVGVLSGVFDYGSVQIQTAAEEENFEFAAVPHPQSVVKQLEELLQKEEKTI